MKRLYLIALSILLLALMTSCGRKYKKTPIDNYIVQHTKQKNFSVILDDMDVEGTFFKTHKMKFKVILEDEEGELVLAPYQCIWLANRRKHLPY